MSSFLVSNSEVCSRSLLYLFDKILAASSKLQNLNDAIHTEVNTFTSFVKIWNFPWHHFSGALANLYLHSVFIKVDCEYCKDGGLYILHGLNPPALNKYQFSGIKKLWIIATVDQTFGLYFQLSTWPWIYLIHSIKALFLELAEWSINYLC